MTQKEPSPAPTIDELLEKNKDVPEATREEVAEWQDDIEQDIKKALHKHGAGFALMATMKQSPLGDSIVAHPVLIYVGRIKQSEEKSAG